MRKSETFARWLRHVRIANRQWKVDPLQLHNSNVVLAYNGGDMVGHYLLINHNCEVSIGTYEDATTSITDGVFYAEHTGAVGNLDTTLAWLATCGIDLRQPIEQARARINAALAQPPAQEGGAR